MISQYFIYESRFSEAHADPEQSHSKRSSFFPFLINDPLQSAIGLI